MNRKTPSNKLVPAEQSDSKSSSKTLAKPAANGRTRGRPSDPAAAVGSEGLVQTAIEMLREVGPAGVTRASLARRAKVAPGLVRYYFKNRDSLIREATLELHKAQQKRATELAEEEGLSPAERICARALALLDIKLANPFYHHLILEELAKICSRWIGLSGTYR